MSSAKNTIVIAGNLTADPEKISDRVYKFRIAVSRAGQNRDDKTDNTGFFNATYFVNPDSPSPNNKFVLSQIEAGNLKKGSGVGVVGELRQERWVSNDKNGQAVVIVADQIDYAGNASASGGSKPQAESAESSSSSDDASEDVAFKF